MGRAPPPLAPGVAAAAAAPRAGTAAFCFSSAGAVSACAAAFGCGGGWDLR